ncbi:MAG: hypothetical protein AAGL49_12765 [Pseudomonadota bacterium]
MTAIQSLRSLAGDLSGALGLHRRISEERREALGVLANTWLGQRELEAFGRLPLYRPGDPFILFWSQKAGSTGAATWYFHRAGLLEEARRFSPWIHDYETQVFKRRPTYAADVRRALDNGVPALKIVRDPAARAFSGFLELNRMGVIRQRRDHWSVYWRKRLVRAVHGASAPFETPVAFNAYLDWLAGLPVRALNGHMAPQSGPVEARLGERIVSYKADDGPEVFGRIEQAFDLTPTEPHRLRAFAGSGHHHRKEALAPETLARFVAEGLPIDRTPETVFPRIDAKAAVALPDLDRRLRRVYGGDYARYGYG